MKLTKKQQDQLNKLNPYKYDEVVLNKILANAEAQAIREHSSKRHNFKSQVEFAKLAFALGKQGLELDLSKDKTPDRYRFYTRTSKAELHEIVTTSVEQAKSDYLEELEHNQTEWLESEISHYFEDQKLKEVQKVENQKARLFSEILSTLE